MAYKATPLALEAKALLKRHLHLNDGAAQAHVDTLSDALLTDLVACNDYPVADRSEVIRGVLTRALAPEVQLPRAVPPRYGSSAPVPTRFQEEHEEADEPHHYKKPSHKHR